MNVHKGDPDVLYNLAQRLGFEKAFNLLVDALQNTSYSAGFQNAGGKLDGNGEPIHKVKRAKAA